MKIYAIHSRFYDDGRITAHRMQYELPEKPANKYIEHRDYDAYFDYYTSEEERDKAYAEIKEEEL